MRNPFSLLWRRYNRFLDTHPFTSTVSTAAVLYGAGDLMCQGVEIAKHGKTSSKDVSTKDTSNPFALVDYGRAARMTAYGAVVFGITSFFWYKALDTRLARFSTGKQVGAKVLLDEFVYAPFCITSLFGCLSYMEGKDWDQIRNKVTRDFWPTFKVDLLVWPALQTINFYLLPLKYRVLYISVCTLFWNIFLSSMYQH